MPGICRTYYSHTAIGNSEKIIIEVREDDGSITSYKVQASQIDGKTEEELNTALDTWISFNYGANWRDILGDIGIHIRTDNGNLVLWTGHPPSVWPEDVVQ